MKASGSGRQGFLLVLALAGVAMGIWFYSRYALLVIAGIYVTHGVVWWLLRPLFIRPSVPAEAEIKNEAGSV